jgi:fucose permease
MSEQSLKSNRDIHQTLTWVAWAAVVILIINTSHFIGEEVGGIMVENPQDWIDVFNGFLIAWAIGDFALLFGRCGEGEVFTDQNLKTFRSGASSLVMSGIWAGIIGPTLLGWIQEEFRGVITNFPDFALAVIMMGIILYGLALVFQDAISIKQENDEFV